MLTIKKEKIMKKDDINDLGTDVAHSLVFL